MQASLSIARSDLRPTKPRPSSCCTKVSAAWACGAISRTGLRQRRAAACSSTHAQVTVHRARSPCRVRSTTCTSKRSMCCRRCWRRTGFRRGLLVGHSDGASIAAIYAGGVQDHRIRGLSLIAPHFIVEDISVRSIAAITTKYEQLRSARKTLALARRRRQRLLWLERCVARPGVPRLGYLRISHLHPRAGADRAGCRRSIRHPAADRGRAGGVLLPGRCGDDRSCRSLAASRGGGCNARRPSPILPTAFCKRTARVRSGGPRNPFQVHKNAEFER